MCLWRQTHQERKRSLLAILSGFICIKKNCIYVLVLVETQSLNITNGI